MNETQLTITVIGAGNGGKAMAADLAAKGFAVRLYNRTFANIETVALRKGIALHTEDGHEVFGPLEIVTSDIEMALDGADLIMVVIPASGHRDVALAASPFLQDNQIVVLNPGRTGGALEFAQGLLEGNCPCRPTICEAETFLFASRSLGPAEARIFRTKYSVPVAAFPTQRTQAAIATIQTAYPQFIPAKSVLHTSMNNMGAIFHPGLTLLNAGWIEATQGDFEFYMDGVTPSTSRVLEALDRERVTVASSLGIRVQTAQEWLYRAYAAEGESLHEAMHANPGYRGIKAPNRLKHRYLFEEIPCSLVPITELGKQYGVETPTMCTLIHLANIVHAIDYRTKGRTLKRLGIQGLTVQELRRYIDTGERS
ncbi:MAG: NAD/NADP octopine/nopaline dehydrogenase family protein [Anaerolineae bacterium]|nr:NAD/NADP octopine/nopaline dehydrogenase family protein [Anaerolineae bacterium]